MYVDVLMGVEYYGVVYDLLLYVVLCVLMLSSVIGMLFVNDSNG